MSTINKLAQSKIYIFVEAKKLNTKYGETFLLTDELGDKYFATSKISKFINEQDFEEVDDIITFEPSIIIRTKKYKEFTTKEGNVIKYLDLNIKLSKSSV